MARHAVLLRAVNVGGHNRVPMAQWRSQLVDLGASNVQTMLASGQAALTLPDGVSPKAFATAVQAELARGLGVTVAVLMRSHTELAEVVRQNPFPELVATPKRLQVIFLDAEPDLVRLRSLSIGVGSDGSDSRNSSDGGDQLAPGPGVLYAAYRTGSHDSPLVGALRTYGGVQTARNIATVLKLLDLTA